MAADNGDDRLRLLIERIERLEEEKKGIGDDIKDVYGEAKATGYDAKIMRQIVRLRKMKPDDRREMEAVLDTYKNALGMGFGDTPLGRFADSVAEGRVHVSFAGKAPEPEPTEQSTANTKGSSDPVYAQAKEKVLRERQVSISNLQKTFTIGYNRASAIVDAMAVDGLIGPPNNVGRREVLASAA